MSAGAPLVTFELRVLRRPESTGGRMEMATIPKIKKIGKYKKSRKYRKPLKIIIN